MKIIKKIAKKIKSIISTPKSPLLFFTKDVFKGKKFIIGDYTYGNPTVLFENEEANLTIGKFCSIADNVTIFLGGNHRTDWITTYPFNTLKTYFPEANHIKGHPSTKGDVIIGNDVWIGRNVIIMSGITIGNGAVIAVGAVVSKNIGDYEIWGGNPARLLKKRFGDETINELVELAWWNWDLKKIKKDIVHLSSSNLTFLKNEN
jgi:acetyltransferase-like isoleucine patch superfamily enzyme